MSTQAARVTVSHTRRVVFGSPFPVHFQPSRTKLVRKRVRSIPLLNGDGGGLEHLGELFGAGDELRGLGQACMQRPLVEQVGLQVI